MAKRPGIPERFLLFPFLPQRAGSSLLNDGENFFLSITLFSRKRDNRHFIWQQQRLPDNVEIALVLTLFANLVHLVRDYDERHAGAEKPACHRNIIGGGLMPHIDNLDAERNQS